MSPQGIEGPLHPDSVAEVNGSETLWLWLFREFPLEMTPRYPFGEHVQELTTALCFLLHGPHFSALKSLPQISSCLMAWRLGGCTLKHCTFGDMFSPH